MALAKRTQVDVADFTINLYVEQNRTLDKLPYTDEFEVMYEAYQKEFADSVIYSKHLFWCYLVRLRKDGCLPNKTERKTSRRAKRDNKDKRKKYGGFGL